MDNNVSYKRAYMASPQAPPTPILKLSDMTPKLCVQNDPTRCYLHLGSLSNMTRVQVDPVLPYHSLFPLKTKVSTHKVTGVIHPIWGKNRNLRELGGELPTMIDVFHLNKAIRITRERIYSMTKKVIPSQTIMTNRIRAIWKLINVARALRECTLVKRYEAACGSESGTWGKQTVQKGEKHETKFKSKERDKCTNKLTELTLNNSTTKRFRTVRRL
ncbi:hypothetical protein OUZ56_033618 [Daphnia magna]|uniref:Uncharacterized protein n=1 Tax=Daphnia magna TaxID=35525 RepID=A0ABQ9ZYX2_9CRUS|nr:hypothetical protein OUZ56_018455 [Daphnia magna]KAK4017799.1 hypothetical protein OUZ56_033618 [Daphnia magna]